MVTFVATNVLRNFLFNMWIVKSSIKTLWFSLSYFCIDTI